MLLPLTVALKKAISIMKKVPKDERYQERLSDKAADGELNDYEANFIPAPASGPFQTPEQLQEALGLDFFSPARLEQARATFRSQFTAAEEPALTAMEEGLRAYVLSATQATEPLLQLKLSAVQAGDELKAALQDGHPNLCALEQHKPELLTRFADAPEITPAFLSKYARITRQVVKEVLIEHAQFLETDMPDFSHEYQGIDIFRGIYNHTYYDGQPAEPDFLSLYTDTEGARLPYWEPEILNSYSLSFDLAERFMVYRKNQRRAKITGTYANIEHRLLASFITSSSFAEGQFELLVLAVDRPGQILVENTEGPVSEFRLI